MSDEAWVFMVGFRVFDVGLLLIWLVWFFRLRRDDGEDQGGEDDGGGGGNTRGPGPKSPGGGGLDLPLGRWPLASRDRLGKGLGGPERKRGAEPGVPQPVPARVRMPNEGDYIRR